MRVTNSLITRDTIARLQTNQRRVAESLDRATTGLRVRKMSDDPSDASAVLETSASLRALTQHRRNVESVGARLAAEESAIGTVNEILMRAKELALQEGGATSSAATRTAAAAEVRQLLEQAVGVGNQQFGEEFLFGGASSAALAPFDRTQTGQAPLYVSVRGAPAAPVVPRGAREVEISAGQTMAGAHDGATVFLDTGVFQSLHDLEAALLSDDSAGIEAAATAVDRTFDDVQALVGDIGARQTRVDTLLAGFDALQLALEERKSDLREVDMEQAITEMLNRQTAYQAAMLAASKVMGMSLADYIR
jgi:flagellar hook-associated protein 3 FlgL